MCTAAVMPPHVDTATHTITASYPADNVHSASDNSSQSDSKNVLTVTKGTPVIAWSAPAPIGYGTALSATQLDASASYNSSPLAGSFAYTPAAGSVLAAGTQTLSVTFTPTDNADYTTATQTVQLRVKQAPLTVTANNKTKAYGAPLPILDASYSGFVNGEGASVLSGTLSCTQASHVAGSPYPITCSGQTSSNYNITYVPGALTVTAVQLSITANNKSKPYGAPLPSLDARYSGFVLSDGPSSLTGTLSCTTTATQASHVAGNPILSPAPGRARPTTTSPTTLAVSPSRQHR